MEKSILNGNRVLAVDGKPDLLAALEKEISASCPGCKLETATTYWEAAEKMISLTYDTVVLGSVGARDSDLMEVAKLRSVPVVMLTAVMRHDHSPRTGSFFQNLREFFL